MAYLKHGNYFLQACSNGKGAVSWWLYRGRGRNQRLQASGTVPTMEDAAAALSEATRLKVTMEGFDLKVNGKE